MNTTKNSERELDQSARNLSADELNLVSGGADKKPVFVKVERYTQDANGAQTCKTITTVWL